MKRTVRYEQNLAAHDPCVTRLILARYPRSALVSRQRVVGAIGRRAPDKDNLMKALRTRRVVLETCDRLAEGGSKGVGVGMV